MQHPVAALSFQVRERRQQTAYFEEQFPNKIGFSGMAFRLHPEYMGLNLAPAISDRTLQYFKHKNISWHTHANHALSSQVCCLNFLMPLADQPEKLSRLVGEALGIKNPVMLEIEKGPDGGPLSIGFEWNGEADYLNEANRQGGRTRGANSTSADAVVRFRHQDQSRIETILIEWKYTESYGAPLSPSGNQTRICRYQHLVFAPDGPVRILPDLRLEDFFYEPFYQLLRQQMLAYQMEKAREQGTDRVRVLHIAPSGNLAVRRVTSPALKHFGDDAFEVFRSLLVRPEGFISRSTETLFRPLLSGVSDPDDWITYITRRYLFLA